MTIEKNIRKLEIIKLTIFTAAVFGLGVFAFSAEAQAAGELTASTPIAITHPGVAIQNNWVAGLIPSAAFNIDSTKILLFETSASFEIPPWKYATPRGFVWATTAELKNINGGAGFSQLNDVSLNPISASEALWHPIESCGGYKGWGTGSSFLATWSPYAGEADILYVIDVYGKVWKVDTSKAIGNQCALHITLDSSYKPVPSGSAGAQPGGLARDNKAWIVPVSGEHIIAPYYEIDLSKTSAAPYYILHTNNSARPSHPGTGTGTGCVLNRNSHRYMDMNTNAHGALSPVGEWYVYHPNGEWSISFDHVVKEGQLDCSSWGTGINNPDIRQGIVAGSGVTGSFNSINYNITADGADHWSWTQQDWLLARTVTHTAGFCPNAPTIPSKQDFWLTQIIWDPINHTVTGREIPNTRQKSAYLWNTLLNCAGSDRSDYGARYIATVSQDGKKAIFTSTNGKYSHKDYINYGITHGWTYDDWVKPQIYMVDLLSVGFDPADVNVDDQVNIKDIQICIKAIVAPQSVPEYLQKCQAVALPPDVVNIKDIQAIIRKIINPN